MFDNIEPDTEQDRRFMYRMLKIFSDLDGDAQGKGLDVANSFLDSFCSECKNIGDYNFPNAGDIKNSYDHFLQAEKDSGKHIPVVKFIEKIISDSTDPNIISFKDFYFLAKSKYIKYEESEDISNF
jgi:hypothetical protein